MNIIEQLGGYEETKKHLESRWCDDDNKAYLLEKLLEYRRQHKFYEEGDKVICEHYDMDGIKDILTVEIVRGHYLQLSHGVSCVASLVRHATEAEIKAGKRLEILNESE